MYFSIYQATDTSAQPVSIMDICTLVLCGTEVLEAVQMTQQK